MTGNKILIWEAETREIANNLIDFIVNDGFLSLEGKYALLWQDKQSGEVQTLIDDLGNLQLIYQELLPQTPKCIIDRSKII